MRRLCAEDGVSMIRYDLAADLVAGFRVLRRTARLSLCGALWLATITRALAGPPYLTDDPEPTDYQHFEIYAFTQGMAAQGDTSGQSGIDFNYGGAPNLQLTATVPLDDDFSALGPAEAGLGNVELAAKYRFLTQQNFGLDVAVFPRVFLPSASSNIGDQHASFLLPVWLEKDWGKWSAYGGGGCELNRGGDSQNFCQAGLVVTNQVRSDLQLGVEIFHQTADTIGGQDTTSVGTGVRYDLNDHFHLLGYVGRGIENVDATDRLNWYTSVLFTF
jgi:Putative MetA-pathway of phenol degradation